MNGNKFIETKNSVGRWVWLVSTSLSLGPWLPPWSYRRKGVFASCQALHSHQTQNFVWLASFPPSSATSLAAPFSSSTTRPSTPGGTSSPGRGRRRQETSSRKRLPVGRRWADNLCHCFIVVLKRWRRMGIILWNLRLEMARSFVLTSSPIFWT